MTEVIFRVIAVKTEDSIRVIGRSGTPDAPFGRGQSCEPRRGEYP